MDDEATGLGAAAINARRLSLLSFANRESNYSYRLARRAGIQMEKECLTDLDVFSTFVRGGPQFEALLKTPRAAAWGRTSVIVIYRVTKKDDVV